MSSKRFFFIMVGLVGLMTVLSVAGIVLGSGFFAKKNNRLTELKLENRVLEEQKLSIIQAKKDIEQYAELEQIAKQIVPQDKDQALAVREIVKFAQEAGIRIGSITFPTSTLGTKAPKKPAAAPEGEEKTDAPPAPKVPPITQVEAVEGITGVFQMEINIQSVENGADFPKLINFLERLESNRHTAQVAGITITPNSEDRSQLTFSTTVNIYIRP